ncbi:PSD1 and planctomycete cytochrome C domain-containing protein [Granulicella arctica]|uniref:Cytochrome c553 n=1 Tax=Granulicella arctica TaxID=940613 RepID=A0A7Y9PHB4_9BACT|nr:PSD1 and planctomycete cytochrome C domain-containing protein [Granulicella arctica]NYF79832.1 cytochrome c553 [Granulicella arctica]
MSVLSRYAQPVCLALPVIFFAAIALRTGVVAPVAAASGPLLPTPAQAAFFEQSIRPVLSNNCYGCHSATTKAAGGLRVDDLDALFVGGKSGPAIIPGKPDESLLLQRILLDDEKHRMPKGDDPLSKTDIANLTIWIKEGAIWPSNGTNRSSANTTPAAVRHIARFNPSPPQEQLVYFEKNVKPILVNHCYACHAADTKPAAGLRLDTSIGIESGGASGAAIIPNNPEQSLLLQRILLTDKKHRMPKDSAPLSKEEIAAITLWIKQGGALPDETEKLPPLSAKLSRTYATLKTNHWAFKPLTHPPVPSVTNHAWPTGDIDRFILASLDEKKMTPVADADPVALIRRVTYDLTGLPPTPTAVAAFRKDHSPRSYERLVDSLLQSRQFGERWGRHWLDIARYGESTGPSRNVPYPHAWRYRDYVIDSVNKDVPYDRFLQEQIAGDLLPADSPSERDRLLTATGFLALGVKDVNQRFAARFQMDNVDEQIDTVTRSTLAMTVTCARCHDHKFDPIPTTDYYALAGIFTSTDNAAGVNSKMGGAGLDYYKPKDLLLLSSAATAPPPPADQIAKLKVEIAAAKKAFEDIQDTPEGLALGPDKKPKQAAYRIKLEKLKEEQLFLTDPGTLGFAVHGAREGEVADTSVRIRGVEERHGPVVPRGFLTAFEVPGAPTINPKQSGRLELAEWITSPTNPLTARVAVNRIWQHLFGQGIVTTVDNFGVTGDRPSNPQLLDYLAGEFIQDNWSTKKLVREIVLSHAYQLGSDFPDRYRDIDPTNRLTWRHSPRRLETEEIRDSILASSGRLQLQPPAIPPVEKLKMIELADNGPELRSINEQADASLSRSIYLPLLRGVTPRALAAFDPVSQTLVTGQRDTTIVPTQALFMLNSSFVRQQSVMLADRLIADHAHSINKRIQEAYQRILGRAPTNQEITRDSYFLKQYEETYSKQPPPSPARPVEEKSQIAVKDVIVDPADDIDQSTPVIIDSPIVFKSPEEAALTGLVQTLYASAEFQFVR